MAQGLPFVVPGQLLGYCTARGDRSGCHEKTSTFHGKPVLRLRLLEGFGKAEQPGRYFEDVGHGPKDTHVISLVAT